MDIKVFPAFPLGKTHKLKSPDFYHLQLHVFCGKRHLLIKINAAFFSVPTVCQTSDSMPLTYLFQRLCLTQKTQRGQRRVSLT